MSGLPFGFALPWILVTIPIGITTLVYAYRRRARGMPKVVASVILLRQLKRRASVRRHFKPPARFFFELLLLMLLALGAAGLFQATPGERVALVIDTSLSMSARRPGATNRERRFDVAQRDAQQFLGDLGAASLIDIFPTHLHGATSATLEKLSPAHARDRLADLVPTQSSDGLDELLQRLARSAQYDRVLAFTDKVSSTTPISGVRSTQIITAHFDEQSNGAPNLALSGLQILRTDRPTLVASIEGWVTGTASFAVTLEAIGRSGTPHHIGRQRGVVRSGATSTVSFPLPDDGALAYHAQLEEDSPAHNDATNKDNDQWIGRENLGQRLFVASAESVERLGLSAVRGTSVVPLSAAELDTFSRSKTTQGGVEATSGDLLVIHRLSTSTIPALPTLLVAGEINGEFSLGAQGSSLTPTRWENSHSITSYLNLPLLSLPQGFALRGPAWSRAIVHSSIGPLLLAGERDGVRFVATGFELFPFEGKRAPLLSILTFNILKWLGGSTQAPGVVAVGESVELPAGTVFSVLGGPAPLEESGERNYSLRTVGIGALLLRDTAGKERVLTPAFFDEEESNTAATFQTAAVELTNRNTQTSDQATIRLSWILALLAFTMILLDLLYQSTRSLRRPAATGHEGTRDLPREAA